MAVRSRGKAKTSFVRASDNILSRHTESVTKMSIFFILAAVVLELVGLVGCFVPIIPGPVVSYVGLLILIPSGRAPSAVALVGFGVVMVIVTLLDYIAPSFGAKRFQCSKRGIWGCTIGTILGMFALPAGLLLGPFLGAFIGELLARKRIRAAAWGGLGAFLGFLTGVVVKCAACFAMTICLILCI